MDQSSRALLLTLLRARTLITSEDNWLANGYAADAQGTWTPFGAIDASRFTVFGAIMRASKGSPEIFVAARTLFNEVAPELFAKLTAPKDALTHAQSLEILDLATAVLMPKHQSGFVAAMKEPATEVELVKLAKFR